MRACIVVAAILLYFFVRPSIRDESAAGGVGDGRAGPDLAGGRAAAAETNGKMAWYRIRASERAREQQPRRS